VTNPTAAGGGVGVNDPGRNVDPTLTAGVTKSLLSVAVFYAREHGFYVHPFTINGDRKVPLTEHGCLDATVDLDQIDAWWSTWPTAWIGINCGRSGLVVIDCDRNKPLSSPYDRMRGVHDGEDVFAVLAEEHGFPWTRSVRTQSGGVHYYYLAPADLSGPFKSKIGPLVDVRAGNKSAIAAGSPGYSVLDRQPIQPLPGWLAQMVRHEERKPVQIAPGSFHATGSVHCKPWSTVCWSHLLDNGTARSTGLPAEPLTMWSPVDTPTTKPKRP
jgi:Bifunctional DNA primase/polymerase, N-terminal